jgi:DNA-binding transcriptional MerR regulator
VTSIAPILNPSEAAKSLGVSTKALRLYEERGLLKPLRTSAGWRAYGPNQMTRASEIIELRRLGLSLAEIGRVLDGDAQVFARALVAHEIVLEARARQLHETVHRIRNLRTELDCGTASVASVVLKAQQIHGTISVSINLPWPWDGEHFEMREIRPLTHIVGPLGSGKTRLAMGLAEAIPGASFIGLGRLDNKKGKSDEILGPDPLLESRVHESVIAIVELGGYTSDALVTLVTAIENEGPTVQVVDMLEEGLDASTQEALICFLRRRRPKAPLIFLTRSTCILDVDSVGPDETIILCPANHSVPMFVAPYRGTPGYEALITCLATPDVRARTAGVTTIRRSA